EESKVRLESQVEEISQLYDVLPLGMALIDANQRYVRINPLLAEINGVSPQAHIGRTMRDIVPGVADQAEDHFRRVVDSGKAINGDNIVGQTTGTTGERIFETDWFPYTRGSDGTVTGVGVIVRDITEQSHMSEELKRVLLELQHRVKNMLATVMALMNQAVQSAEPGASDAITNLRNRVNALAQTHSLLANSDWRSAGIRQIIQNELAPYLSSDQVTLSGPDLTMNAKATLNLSMAVHELATNAAKYGALSSVDGRLSVRWLTQNDGDGEKLKIIWEEDLGDGQTLRQSDEPESRNSGFGTKLIGAVVERTLDGTVERRFEQDGLKCFIEIDMDALTAKDSGYETLKSEGVLSRG
ncbi:MAG: HWE histidine kinase domain-containing protein, partial [Pseudomonadota bacterium]